MIIIPRRHYTQPQGRVEVDWANPLAQGLLVAATPFSEMATRPEIRYGARGAGARGGVLNRGPVTHGVANSTVFILTQALVPDDGSWWNSSGIIFVDTRAAWPNDRGLRVHAPKIYGVMSVSARDTTGSVYTAEVDVLDGAQTYGGSFSGAATVGADLLVTGFGGGKKWGTSTGLQGYSYNAPDPTYSGPRFGASITDSGSMDHLSLMLRWGRVCSDEEIFEVERNPWQLFRADPVRIYSLPSGAISINSILVDNITQTGARITLELTR